MLQPVSREGKSFQKTAPCGRAGSVRGASPVEAVAGSKLMLAWDEYIDHNNGTYYRIEFDLDGDDDFEDPETFGVYETDLYPLTSVLVDGIPDKQAPDSLYAYEVTLPDVECDNCTLRVIQAMGGNQNMYYHCIDLTLTAAPTDDPGDEPGDDEEDTSNGGGDDEGDTNGNGGDSADSDGGTASGGEEELALSQGDCSQAGTLPILAILGGVVLALRRRSASR